MQALSPSIAHPTPKYSRSPEKALEPCIGYSVENIATVISEHFKIIPYLYPSQPHHARQDVRALQVCHAIVLKKPYSEINALIIEAEKTAPGDAGIRYACLQRFKMPLENSRPIESLGALSFSVLFDNPALCKRITQHFKIMYQGLKQQNADKHLNATDTRGNSALHFAAMKSSRCYHILIEAGAISMSNRAGYKPEQILAIRDPLSLSPSLQSTSGFTTAKKMHVQEMPVQEMRLKSSALLPSSTSTSAETAATSVTTATPAYEEFEEAETYLLTPPLEPSSEELAEQKALAKDRLYLARRAKRAAEREKRAQTPTAL